MEAFSDGIFAIAATLLILNVQVPHASAGQLTHQLLELWPSYIAYATSFVTIGVMWLNHHAIFSRVARVDRPLVVFNLFMLGVISFLPFPTQVLGGHIGTAQDATHSSATGGSLRDRVAVQGGVAGAGGDEHIRSADAGVYEADRQANGRPTGAEASSESLDWRGRDRACRRRQPGCTLLLGSRARPVRRASW